MPVDVYKNIVAQHEINELLNWYNVEDEYIDDRPDVFSKRPDWDSKTNWPRETIKSILDRTLPDSYGVHSVIWYHQKTVAFQLHVDTADGNQETLYKNILIPLQSNGDGTTVIFKNRWYGPLARFSKSDNSVFRYKLPLLDSGFETVPDIRRITDLSRYRITQQELDNLIELRSGTPENNPDATGRKGVTKTSPNTLRNANYAEIEGYDPTIKFDKQIHQTYLNHLDIESLHGLTVEYIYQWQIGDVLTFDRQQLHSAGSTHTEKKGITIFTTK